MRDPGNKFRTQKPSESFERAISVNRSFKVAAVLIGLAGLAACSSTPSASRNPSASPTPSGTSTEKPVAPENNPPGDIPDNQAFVAYAVTAAGFELKVPEGWARTTASSGITFSDKL